MKIHVWHTGRVRVSEAVPYKSNNPLAFLGLGKERILELPVSCYLIEYDNKKVLVDTGWHLKYVNGKLKRFWGLEDRISHPIVNDDEIVTKHLEKIGVEDKDLDYCVLSHLDLDHASGLELVKNCPHIIVSKEEIMDSKKNKLRYDNSLWKNINLEEFNFEEMDIGPVKKGKDLFQDGKIILVNTPGHSHGHTSVVVNNNGKYVVIAGDCVYTHKSWEEEKVPGFMVDKELAYKSMEWIRNISKDKDCLEILANHDDEVMEHIIEF